MRFTQLSALLALAASANAAWKSVGDYIAFEKPVAKSSLLANIGDKGARAPGAFPGVVVASPSTEDPDYFFTWVRDSSLVFKVLADQFTQGKDKSLRPLIDAFAISQSHIQKVANPSGNITSGGLGEPKFYVNETAFEGSWGRPQRDGPALRATTLITYANWLLDQGNKTFVSKTLWPVIQLDLDYVASTWNWTGFDLWEEVRGASFFTTSAQHRALREGAALARTLNKASSSYTTQATNALCFLQTYWSPSGGYAIANVGPGAGGRSGIDANIVLASIHAFDPEAGCDNVTFQPCSDRALLNLRTYIESFRSVYALNAAAGSTDALAVGRYKEDVYYGGNPWYLSVFAVAEQLYDALYVWDRQRELGVTVVSLPFFAQFDKTIKAGTYKSGSSTYKALTKAIKTYADGFILLNAKYTPVDGSLSEQFERSTGAPLSARHLTWSYAAALTAFAARDGSGIPESWGAKGLKVPNVCQPGPPVPQATVTFDLQAAAVQGENLFVVGSADELKNWSPENAIGLTASALNPTAWTVTLKVVADTRVEYKYIRKNQGGGVTWESDPNRVLTTPGEGGTLIVNDVWR